MANKLYLICPLGWVLGDHSAITFRPLWEARWQLEMLLLYHRWMASLPHVYPRWIPNYL